MSTAAQETPAPIRLVTPEPTTLEGRAQRLASMIVKHENRSLEIAEYFMELEHDYKLALKRGDQRKAFTVFLVDSGIAKGSIGRYRDIGIAMKSIRDQARLVDALGASDPMPIQQESESLPRNFSGNQLQQAGKALRGGAAPSTVTQALENGNITDVATAQWNAGLVPLEVTLTGKGLALEAVKSIQDAHERLQWDRPEQPEALQVAFEIIPRLEAGILEQLIAGDFAGRVTTHRERVLERAVKAAQGLMEELEPFSKVAGLRDATQTPRIAFRAALEELEELA
jgi:hypothetical protein